MKKICILLVLFSLFVGIEGFAQKRTKRQVKPKAETEARWVRTDNLGTIMPGESQTLTFTDGTFSTAVYVYENNPECTQENLTKALAIAAEDLKDPDPDSVYAYPPTWSYGDMLPFHTVTIKPSVGLRKEADRLREEAKNKLELAELKLKEAEQLEWKSKQVKFALAVANKCTGRIITITR